MVSERLNDFTTARAKTSAAVAPFSQTQLDFSPRPGRWSIGEVADHLLLAEDLYRGEITRLVELARTGRRAYLKHSFDEINVAPLYLPTAVLSVLEVPLGIMSRFIPGPLVSFMTEFPLIPTRNPDRTTPRAGRSAGDLREDLARSIRQTRAIIIGNADLDFRRMVSEHPLTGANNVPAILAFLTRHERRHQGQMARVSSDPRFPAA
jgi:uncharacterized damage-inducible protein DinB